MFSTWILVFLIGPSVGRILFGIKQMKAKNV